MHKIKKQISRYRKEVMYLHCRITAVFFLVASIVSSNIHASENTMHVYKINHKPTMDAYDDWSKIPFKTIPLKSIKNHLKQRNIQLKAAVYNEHIYFFAIWEDGKADLEHKPYIWNKKDSRYVIGPQREDRLVLQFGMKGEYTTNWPAAEYFTADTWHWKSYRSAPLNLAHDKHIIVSSKKMSRSQTIPSHDGGSIYIKRLNDKGTPLYLSQRYGRYKKDKLPKYIINKNTSGSITDVKTNSRWDEGKWNVEIKRKLLTGNNDDVKFIAGKKVNAGIAVFDGSENNMHFISETLELIF